MKTLKEAWTLVKFEHKMTPPSYVLVLFMFAIALLFLVTTFTGGVIQATVGTEAIFLLVTVAFPYMIRLKQLQPQNLGLKHRVSPIIILLQTMPISKRTIATYRMLSYVGVSIIYNSIFFSLFYFLSPYMRSIAPPQTYIVFAIMWICISIYIGGLQVNIEAGYHFLTQWFFLFLFWVPGITISIIVLFYKIYTKGLIQWMLDVSADYPLIVVSVSIVLAIAGYLFHMRGFMKRIEKVDY